MKKICIIFSIFALAIGFHSCGEAELPYDLSSIKRGVLIDISKGVGAGFIVPFAPLQNEVVTMPIVLSVFENGDGPFTSIDLVVVHNLKKSYILQSNITSLPATINVNYHDVLALIGVSSLKIEDRIYFTANAHLPDGTIVYGWRLETGFNNVSFGEYLDSQGNSYKSNVYWVAKGVFYSNTSWLNEFWSGQATSSYFRANTTINDTITNASIEVLPIDDVPTTAQWAQMGITGYENFDLAGFKIKRFFFDNRPGVQDGTESAVKIWVNTATKKVYIPNQPIGLIYDVNQWNSSIPSNYLEINLGSTTSPTTSSIDVTTGKLSWVSFMSIGSTSLNRVTFNVQSHKFIN